MHKHPSLHELYGCVHDATKISHHTENKQKWHVASVDIITKLLLFFVLFLTVAIRQMEEKPMNAGRLFSKGSASSG